MTATEITFEQVFTMARRLRPVDQARLVAQLAPNMERLAEQVEFTTSARPRTPLRGPLADKDDLSEGGWEIERAKYPGLSLPLPTGQVLHGQAKLLDCWVAESLTVAVLATRTTWYLGRTGEARELAGYQPGAWSRFHVLPMWPASSAWPC